MKKKLEQRGREQSSRGVISTAFRLGLNYLLFAIHFCGILENFPLHAEIILGFRIFGVKFIIRWQSLPGTIYAQIEGF